MAFHAQGGVTEPQAGRADGKSQDQRLRILFCGSRRPPRRRSRWRWSPSRVESAADIERAIESIARGANGGIVITPDSTNLRNRDLIIALAARHRVPVVYPERIYAVAGGLMSYGIADPTEPFRQAASYIDRILRGEKPADLPVQVPTKYLTTINVRTAKALGVTVPPGPAGRRRRSDRVGISRRTAINRCRRGLLPIGIGQGTDDGRTRRGQHFRSCSARLLVLAGMMSSLVALPLRRAVAAGVPGRRHAGGKSGPGGIASTTSKPPIRWARSRSA